MTTSAEQYRALVARLEAIEESPISAVAGAATDAYQGVSNLVRNVSSPQAQQSLANSAKDLLMNLFKISTPGINAEILQFLIKNKNQLGTEAQKAIDQLTGGPEGRIGLMPEPTPGGRPNPMPEPATGAPMRDPRQNTGTSQGAPMRDPRQTKFPNVKGM